MKSKKQLVTMIIVIFASLILGQQFVQNINRNKKIYENSERMQEEQPLPMKRSDEKRESTSPEGREELPPYDGSIYYPYDDMQYADNEVYKVLEKAYGEIDFYSEFKQGNLELYDFYKEKYHPLIKNEVPFLNQKTGEEFYLNECHPMKVYDESKEFDVDEYTYYFFDMDEDGSPEICISDTIHFHYIYKYVPALDRIVLWSGKMDVTWYRLNGSRTIRWNREGTMHEFYKLDQDGEILYWAYFHSRINIKNPAYLLGMPIYTNLADKIEVGEAVKKQGYDTGDPEIIFFRVTKGQYEKLTKDYFEAEELARENLEKVAYSYEELFGNLDSIEE